MAEDNPDPAEEVLVLGHGPIAEATSRLAFALGFTVRVSDPEADPTRFPEASRVTTDDPGYAAIRAGPNTFVVVSTEHKSDLPAVEAALRAGARYVALVASTLRAGNVLNACLDDGFPPETVAAVRSPAGLDLGAKEPEEIGLAIVAEIVAVRRGGSGRPLAEVKGPVLDRLTEHAPEPRKD